MVTPNMASTTKLRLCTFNRQESGAAVSALASQDPNMSDPQPRSGRETSLPSMLQLHRAPIVPAGRPGVGHWAVDWGGRTTYRAGTGGQPL